MGGGTSRAPRLGGSGARSRRGSTRRERRVDLVRHVRYVAFPRSEPDQRERSGFTRDVSTSGMCLRVEAPERDGSLLRVVVHHVDGRTARESLARIAWSRPTADGAWWLGLTVLDDGFHGP